MSAFVCLNCPTCILCGMPFNLGRLRTPHEPIRGGYGWSPEDGARPISKCREAESVCALSHHRDPTTKEHVAAPGVEYRLGYNGYNVTKNEMAGIMHVQCLHMKSSSSQIDGYVPGPMPDSAVHEFELGSDTFLTGISTRGPDVEYQDVDYGGGVFYVGGFKPVRFGRKTAWVTNNFLSRGVYADRCAVPFHPPCFEIFKRISMRRLGAVDIDGLYWLARDENLNQPRFQDAAPIHRGRDIENCSRGGEWRHLIGTEYLTANPVDIPGLKTILETIAFERSQYWQANGFIIDASLSHPKPPHDSDPFQQLPQELRDIITSCLPPRSILSLRLSSRSFDRLPPHYFEHLLREEMPYIWELSDNDSKLLRDAIARRRSNNPYRGYANGRRTNQVRAEPPIIAVDWYRLYAELRCRLIPSIKGLRNRERIWRDVEKIVSMIERSWRREASLMNQ